MIKTVVCVNADGRKNLTLGEEYDVVAIQADGDYVIVDNKGKEVKVLKSRFEDIDDSDDYDMDDDSDSDDMDVAPKFVKVVTCVDASGKKYLTQGKQYNVVALQPDGDYIVIDDKGAERKTAKVRFIDFVDAATLSESIPEVTFDELEALPTTDTDKVSTTMYADDEFSFQFTGTIATWKQFIATIK